MEDIFINSKIFSSNYDILVFTETWLNINVNSAEIGLDDYNIFRDDRNPAYASRGGGVLIAVHKKFKCYVCKHLDYMKTPVLITFMLILKVVVFPQLLVLYIFHL